MSKIVQAHQAMIETLEQLEKEFADAQTNKNSIGCPSYGTACKERLKDYISKRQPCGISCPLCKAFMDKIDGLAGLWKED